MKLETPVRPNDIGILVRSVHYTAWLLNEKPVVQTKSVGHVQSHNQTL